MILSTLAELEEDVENKETQKEDVEKPTIKKETTKKSDTQEVDAKIVTDREFYKNLREKILVLFEGFQSPNNKNLEAKIDLTLNFLEYLLALLDERLEAIDKKSK